MAESLHSSSWKNYSVVGKLPESVLKRLQAQIRAKLSEILGIEADNVLAEYVIVMVGNNKTLEHISTALEELIGRATGVEFCIW
jgi:hypothetical protein